MKVVVALPFFALLFVLSNACHTGQGGKRKKRQTVSEEEDTQVWRDYFTACLEVLAPDESYDWKSNIDFTILDSQWYLGTENVLCSPEDGYDTEECWVEEVAEYVADDDLLPKVRDCIRQYFKDIAHDPPQYTYTKRRKRGVSSNPYPVPGHANINANYASCLQGSSNSLRFKPLLSAIQQHTVVRKCDSALLKRPITYSQKFLYLTRADSPIHTFVKQCNRRHFPAGNFWSVWTPWSACSPSCNGRRTKQRFCHNGNNPRVKLPASSCPGSSRSVQSCYTPYCWSEWTQWSACSKTCHSGTKIRTRACTIGGAYPSTQCPGLPLDTGHCNVGVKCTPTCDGGQVYVPCKRCGRECQFIDFPPPCAPGCRPGCECPGSLWWSNKLKKCVTAAQCKACTQGKIYYPCAPCDKTCEKPNPVCVAICRPGCACPRTQYWTGSKCISECPTQAPIPTWTKWSDFGRCNARGSGPCGIGTKVRTRRCVIGIQQVRASLCSGRATDSQGCIAIGSRCPIG